MLIQVSQACLNDRSICFRIQKMRINARDHIAQTEFLDPENPQFKVQVCPELETLVCGGIEIFGKFFDSK